MEIMNHLKKNGLSTLAGKYEHFTHEIQEAIEENKKALKKLKEATAEAVGEVKDAAHDMQHKVKKSPWTYIGAAAGVGLVMGFLLGKKK